MNNTRERILEEAMKLFSTIGYDSTSIREIASKVGIVNSALYKHFNSKKAILDAIIERSKEYFLAECDSLNFDIKTSEDVKAICFKMFEFQTTNEWNVMFRRLLTIEQFKNPELCSVYKFFFIDQRIDYQAAFFQKLMDKGYMKKNDPYAVAMELYSPFYMYHNFKDSKDLNVHLSNHVEIFFKNNLLESED